MKVGTRPIYFTAIPDMKETNPLTIPYGIVIIPIIHIPTEQVINDCNAIKSSYK